MNNFEIELLKNLLEKYRNSTLFKQQTKRNIKVKINISEPFLKKYYDSYKTLPMLENSLQELEKLDFVFVKKDKKDNIEYVALNLSNVAKIYELLGVDNPQILINNTINFLQGVEKVGITNQFVVDELQYINKFHKLRYKDLNELKDIILCLNEMQQLVEETMERDFSIKIFGDSKLFSLKYKSKIAKILKHLDDNFNDLNDDEVLKEFNIVKNSSTVAIKNKLNFKINNQYINLNDFANEFYLTDNMIKNMTILESNFDEIITVENLTTFQMLNKPNSLIIFLSGFHNHTKQLLLKKLFKEYPNKNFLHFGDIDVGGFRIFKYLRDNTNIPFVPYKMGLDDILENKKYAKPLSSNDIKQLKQMRQNNDFSIFHDVIDFMLNHNVKLEQESFDI